MGVPGLEKTFENRIDYILSRRPAPCPRYYYPRKRKVRKWRQYRKPEAKGSHPASFEDFRCKCVCSLEKNTTARSVYIGGKDIEHNQCKCKYVIKPESPDFCNRCECKYDRRNTTTIKVVVVFIICVVAMLFVYMLFLLCLDPLIAWRPSHYAEHTNEEEDLSARRLPQMETSAQLLRQRSILNRVTDEQQRWKGTVQEQRRNIYDRHSMLN
ncbi:proton-transporting V-type ATPase complex assembly regulator TMEM9-like isoform X2 [Gigantopelta aegis]|uniref:proton-transporting V-type ATPase complex assembly regulator TMEM9-like isoform X2 n=1 Tax=Gigantopelta aegis TaxID=1735272 RepID=UPI001B88AE4F|nr:proton-transporting V-type ATPase complex assembly regulator TMEM9-like isoform X2 [Gigantopelta aegis]